MLFIISSFYLQVVVHLLVQNHLRSNRLTILIGRYGNTYGQYTNSRHPLSCLVGTDSIVCVQLPRALSLRNLVSGYERGRVFPAGVGPGTHQIRRRWRAAQSSRSQRGAEPPVRENQRREPGGF